MYCDHEDHRHDERRLMSPRRTAKLLDVSLRTLRRWRQAELIGFVLLPSGQYRFPIAEVERVLRRRQAT